MRTSRSRNRNGWSAKKRGGSRWGPALVISTMTTPVAAAAYSSAPNYLITWHTPGVIGRTYKIGARFEF